MTASSAISAHEARIPLDIGGEDRGQLARDFIFRHVTSQISTRHRPRLSQLSAARQWGMSALRLISTGHEDHWLSVDLIRQAGRNSRLQIEANLIDAQ